MESMELSEQNKDQIVETVQNYLSQISESNTLQKITVSSDLFEFLSTQDLTLFYMSYPRFKNTVVSKIKELEDSVGIDSHLSEEYPLETSNLISKLNKAQNLIDSIEPNLFGEESEESE